MAQSSGFFNALKTEAGYDRKYNADDYSKGLKDVVNNGILKKESGQELYVRSSGGMNLSIDVGGAWIEGHWFFSDTSFTDFSVPAAPVGDMGRIDRVVLRLDTSVSKRSIEFAYKKGNPAQQPTAPELTRSGAVYELALADITVNAGVTSISQSNIKDQRSDADLCGMILTSNDIRANISTIQNEISETKALTFVPLGEMSTNVAKAVINTSTLPVSGLKVGAWKNDNELYAVIPMSLTGTTNGQFGITGILYSAENATWFASLKTYVKAEIVYSDTTRNVKAAFLNFGIGSTITINHGITSEADFILYIHARKG